MFIVRYATRPAAADQNQALIEQVFTELNTQRPDGVRYASARLDDGVSFVHLGQLDGESSPLEELDAFQRFQAGIGERLVGPPTRSQATVLGTYRLLPALVGEPTSR